MTRLLPSRMRQPPPSLQPHDDDDGKVVIDAQLAVPYVRCYQGISPAPPTAPTTTLTTTTQRSRRRRFVREEEDDNPAARWTNSNNIYRRNLGHGQQRLLDGNTLLGNLPGSRVRKDSSSSVAVVVSYPKDPYPEWLRLDDDNDDNNDKGRLPKEDCALHTTTITPSYRREVGATLERLGCSVESFWHRGVGIGVSGGPTKTTTTTTSTVTTPSYKKNPGAGLYPFLLEPAMVLVCLPSPSSGSKSSGSSNGGVVLVDPGEWCPDRYPLARNALLEAMGYHEKEEPQQQWANNKGTCTQRTSGRSGRTFFHRQRRSNNNKTVPAVPSLAWGSFNTVQLLAESFCGCLTGTIRLTDRSLEAARTFIGEIQLAQRLVESYYYRQRQCGGEVASGTTTTTVTTTTTAPSWLAWWWRGKRRTQQHPTPPGAPSRYWTESTCWGAIQELECLANEVRDYLRLVVPRPQQRQPPDAFELSRVFVEKMAQASYSSKKDQVMAGALCSYLLQRVAGQGWSTSHALRDIQKSTDPLCFCFYVASLGQYGFGRGISFTQQIASRQRSMLGGLDQKFDKDMQDLWDLWPEPVYGPGFAGSATSSEWKEILWMAIEARQCLGWEDSDEEENARPLVSSIKHSQQQRLTHSMRYLQSRGKHGRESSDALKCLENLKSVYRGPNSVMRSPQQDGDDVRSDWIKTLRQAWHKAQSSFQAVVGTEFPLVLDRANNVMVLYMLDTSTLGGHALDTISGGEIVNVSLSRTKDKDGVGILHKEVQLGESFDISLQQHPLYQMAFSFVENKAVHLVLQRRIWAKAQHIHVPMSLETLKCLCKEQIQPGGVVRMENPYSYEDVSRMADYLTTYPTVVRSAASFHRLPKDVKEMKKSITSLQWTEPSFQCAQGGFQENKEAKKARAKKKKSPPRPIHPHATQSTCVDQFEEEATQPELSQSAYSISAEQFEEEKKEDPIGEEKFEDLDVFAMAAFNNDHQMGACAKEKEFVCNAEHEVMETSKDSPLVGKVFRRDDKVDDSLDQIVKAVRAYCSRGLKLSYDGELSIVSHTSNEESQATTETDKWVGQKSDQKSSNNDNTTMTTMPKPILQSQSADDTEASTLLTQHSRSTGDISSEEEEECEIPIELDEDTSSSSVEGDEDSEVVDCSRTEITKTNTTRDDQMEELTATGPPTPRLVLLE